MHPDTPALTQKGAGVRKNGGQYKPRFELKKKKKRDINLIQTY